MSLPFSITGVGSLLVDDDGYDGFDRPPFATMTSILSNGTSSGDQLIQSGSLPRRQAGLTGTSYLSADIATLRGYSDSKEVVTFTDGDGDTFDVVVMEFSAKAHTGCWDWTMLLVEDEAEGS